MMFIGRSKELADLARLKKKNVASLVCILGRRRIGKSALIAHFGHTFKRCVSIQGLGPLKNANNQDQLDHFATSIAQIFNIPKTSFTDWTEAFYKLGEYVKKGETLILLDEISWMGKNDPLFSAKLKDAWDLIFKKNPQLILVVCGSVSSWIENNILLNANFVGRVSLQIQLEELGIKEIEAFWSKSKGDKVGTLEKMIMLSVTGGVPKYLEEMVKGESLEKTIATLCFNKNGMLFSEYEKIFHEIFDKKSDLFQKIISICMNKKLTITDLAKKLKVGVTGDLTRSLHILELSGFISRDFSFKPDGKVAKESYIRVKDNYLRFYLNYIFPLREKILKGGKVINHLGQLKNFEAILGYQFENLILHNRNLIYPLLDLKDSQIESAAPYTQKKNTKNKGACQIDLLIHTNIDVFYLCEFKCKKIITANIIAEMERKMDVLKLPRRSSVKPVLVYVGEILERDQIKIENYFYKIISLDDF